MRHVTLLAATTLVGCAIENELRYTATLEAETQGVVFTDDGLAGIAAMSGTTCTIDPRWGCPTADVDLPTDGEQIVDHYEGLTLGKSDVGVHTLTGSAWDAANDLILTDVRVARLTDRGRVVLAGTAASCALHVDGAEPVGVPGAWCADDLRPSVDRTTGDLYLAAGGELLRVGPEGAAKLADLDVDRLARDATRAHTYAAKQGDLRLRAIDDAGEATWDTALDVAVRALATRGDRGDVLVLGERPDGGGALLRVDGETGRVRSATELPDGQGELSVSGNGQAVAVIRGELVHFYQLEIEGELTVVDPDPPSCMAEWNTTAD